MFELKQFFCFADPVFFEDVSRWNTGPGFLPDRDFSVGQLAVPDGWSREPRGIWVSLRPDGHVLPEQGWKIHISATMENADRLCSLVWGYCVAKGLPFKHIRDRNMLLALNAKYAARGSSGKLITIYPGGRDEFTSAVTELAALTAGEPGPYILSDLRIDDGPVYVRYGGFIGMDCLDENGEWVRAIRRPDGTLEPDRRKPFFDPPQWANVPEVLAPHLAARRGGGAGDTAPPPYHVQRALHFSNAGGIYLATRAGDGRTVVLKEARPHAGLDDNHEDAVTRQRREVWALRKLQSIDGVPELYDQFVLGGHHFLAEEYIDGQPLHVWYGVHHPCVVNAEPTAEDIAEYTRRAVHIVAQLETLLAAIHARGVVFGDLHLGNIMVRPDDSVALVDFELAFDAADTDWRPGLRATGFGHGDKRGLDVDRYALAAVRLAIFITSSRIAVLEPRKVFQFVRIVSDNFPVPDGWADSILAELAPAPGPHTAPVSPVDLDGPVVDWETVGKSLTEAILSSATPDRTDRLFPGAPEQFAHGGGLGMAYGAAGILWTLSVTGHGRYPEYERWLVDGARRTRRLAPGFYDGAAGVAYALDHLGHGDAADELLDRHLRQVARHQGLSLFSGLAGIGATLLHFGRSRDDRDHLDNAVGIAGRLADAVRHGDPRKVLDSYRGKPVEAGLMRGWSGAALFFIRLYEHTADAGYLDLAVRAIHHDLDRCVVTDDGALMVEEAGVRTMPYLDVGGAGIALVTDELLAHRDDDRSRDSLPQLLLGSRRRFAVQAELFRGFASQIATLARLNHRIDHRSTLERHLRELSWHALSYRGHLAFPGTLGFRLSMDLTTGSAGILFAIGAATQQPQPFLPFFAGRG